MPLLDALARFNDAHPWSHNAHFHRWILRQLPVRFDRALDVGCGSGDLARLLATRAREVQGIDSDERIIGEARASTDPGLPVVFSVADALSYDEGGRFDVITCVAVLHHLPLTETLVRFRQRLAPGGTLVIVGLTREDTRVQTLLGLVSVPLNLITGWIKNRGRKAPRPVAMTAPTRPADVPYTEFVREARRVLPGVRLRRRLFWRQTLVWKKVRADVDPGTLGSTQG
ncbi:SAM-dependent methyltransferase [Streptomyces sp. SAI-208]|jgi:SAM-dependent methyltransferase|uniref:class I SAM-dependent methyltransferase n=1 Tax=unclassified Streptomyces TaxID=2593676 RepID=UPI002476DB52|nr:MULTISPECIES: class I SAM-dependent methyltransferase [unclassified Streptomyces]MDH6518264.1 SAM-dependent methyltransferase [Streptomyces sp. SAI-090]MDH6569544.1 SAM-dependent methyltransferase [Streptomyces sp. SAI-117]MDH6609107.1 SAM-dependent methyltransferase [Streptomyces sp. SAI-208]MDH6617646.1 SAM-dependent methyltransferase [Streptomyces sp. SAI-135]